MTGTEWKKEAEEERRELVKLRARARQELGEMGRDYKSVPGFDEKYAEPFGRLRTLTRELRRWTRTSCAITRTLALLARMQWTGAWQTTS